MDQVEIALVASDRAAADAISRAANEADPEGEATVGEQRGLAGGAAEWVAFLTVASPFIVPILEVILYEVGLGRVEEIEVDGVKIKKPRKQDVEQLLEQHRARAGQ